MEFALRERGGDRILPPKRFFPVDSEGVWLSSSYMRVGQGSTFTPQAAPEPTPAPTPQAETGVWQIDRWTDDLTGAPSVLIYSEATSWYESDSYRGAPWLVARCNEDDFSLWVNWRRYTAHGVLDSEGRGRFAIDGGSARSGGSHR